MISINSIDSSLKHLNFLQNKVKDKKKSNNKIFNTRSVIDKVATIDLRNIFFKYKPDCIFNLAAETHVDRSIDSPESFIQSNIVGVYNLLEYFKSYSKKNKTKLCLSTSGIAGPGGSTKNKPVGLIFIGIRFNKKNIIFKNLR